MTSELHRTCAVCPHCGYKHYDCGLWNHGVSICHEPRSCGKCGERFLYSRIIDISYSTEFVLASEETKEVKT